MSSPKPAHPSLGVRIDKWLWAARFFKTRQLAAQAIRAGKIKINGERAKPAKTINAGDEVIIRRDAITYTVVVVEPGFRRVSAAQVGQLYEETIESVTTRETLAAQQKIQRQSVKLDRGKPSKHKRRLMTKFKRREF